MRPDHQQYRPSWRGVDLFAGVGGLDLPARALGVHVTGIEWSPDACATRRAAGLTTIEGDVRRYGPDDFPDANMLLGGPPCQPFSAAGTGAGRRALADIVALAHRLSERQTVARHGHNGVDDLIRLVLEPLRWVLDASDAGRPFEAIVLEQVPAVLPVWNTYAAILRAEGYSAVAGVVRAEQYGVPQTRKRAVLIARHTGTAALPTPTHRPYAKGVPRTAGDPGLLPWAAMGDVLPERGPFTVVSNYGTGGDPKARGRRTNSEPSATVTGKVSRVRVLADDGTESRFTWSEAGRLQSFPADHPWTGRDIGQQIGNAVPPRLAHHLITAALDGS
ncbi:DNA (cytosine-5)-methyltransferase 1 [Streptomyces sp. 1114.5]|uniref:DNA cytosine methyltransferase n=1 Tax=Streptomyces sp. 1114.5 TaxID=1938830 RepID=UPI000EABDF47|nr:DNA cytosine methyltransferase [Streptomyces sp. 1114.5]RKT18147.1 DNA (cytosine-5)-methyltransferase 1 [Streptomyces sp. 1114.5]